MIAAVLAAMVAGHTPAGAGIPRASAAALATRVTVGVRCEAPGPSVGRRVVDRAWSKVRGGVALDLSLRSTGPRAAHEITLEIAALGPGSRLFTPTERGVIDVDGCPTGALTDYGASGWEGGRFNVLPLVSMMDPKSGRALTVAAPPDPPIPDLRIDWRGGRVLRLRMGRRGVGGGITGRLRLLFLEHAADYRSALRSYSDLFPRWFRPGAPRTADEGAFYYHHIQDHPSFDEMARQDVRFIWMSFWFPFLGDYLPAEAEWFPYTYAKWWALGATMSDGQIRRFVAEMRSRGVGAFAYMNVTEYGGYGGKAGTAAEAQRTLEARFGAALIRDAAGKAVPTWEGAMAMNPSPRYPLFAELVEQVRRHLTRLPEIAGFCIDRLDWCSVLDYAHDDGMTTVATRPASLLAGPVTEAVGEVCRLAHRAGKRVLVNQFWRLEPLRDVDGYCHEADAVRALGYLSPYRPVSAWHQQRGYVGDLLPFEAQMKARLQFAVFPQMIARTFPVSQQSPSPAGAATMEAWAPLFRPLRGADQVLEANCVRATGPNDVNLFVTPTGRWVAPLTSRVRFAARAGGSAPAEPVALTIRSAGASRARWAHVYRLEGPAYRAAVRPVPGGVSVRVALHRTASCVVVGAGPEPAVDRRGEASGGAGGAAAAPHRLWSLPQGTHEARLVVVGAAVGASAGRADIRVGGAPVGALAGRRTTLNVPVRVLGGRRAPTVEIVTHEDGAWYAAERVELRVRTGAGRWTRVAEWEASSGAATGSPRRTRLALEPSAPTVTEPSTVRPAADGLPWPGSRADALWLPFVGAPEQAGYRMEVGEGSPFVWTETTADPRVLPSAEGRRSALCWFSAGEVAFDVRPPDRGPYLLALSLLDFDRNGREEQIDIEDDGGSLAARVVDRAAMARGAILAWEVTGPVHVRVTRRAGFNTVLGGICVTRLAGGQ